MFLFSVFCLLLSIFNVQIQAVLFAEDVSEGECLKRTKAYPNTNFTWFIQPRVFYVPMASEHCYRNYAETFLGRPVDSEEELNDMKLRIDAVYSRAANLGYAQHFIQLCLPGLGFGKINCTFVLGSKGTNSNSLETTIDTIVWTDNASAVLIVQCVNGITRNWKLLTIEPFLEPGVEEQARRVIQELGFNSALVSFRM